MSNLLPLGSLLFGILFIVFAYCAGWLNFMMDDPEDEMEAEAAAALAQIAKRRPPPNKHAFDALAAPMRVAGGEKSPRQKSLAITCPC